MYRHEKSGTKKSPLNTSGFGFGVLIVTVLVTAGAAGTYLYQGDHKTESQVYSAKAPTQKGVAGASSKTANTSNPPAWETYCAPEIAGCFKYPATQPFTDSPPVRVDATDLYQNLPE
jgi:hypothetical protein